MFHSDSFAFASHNVFDTATSEARVERWKSIAEREILHQCQGVLEKIFINNTFVIISRDSSLASCVSTLMWMGLASRLPCKVEKFIFRPFVVPLCATLLRWPFGRSSEGGGVRRDETSFLFNHSETYIAGMAACRM